MENIIYLVIERKTPEMHKVEVCQIKESKTQSYLKRIEDAKSTLAVMMYKLNKEFDIEVLYASENLLSENAARIAPQIDYEFINAFEAEREKANLKVYVVDIVRVEEGVELCSHFETTSINILKNHIKCYCYITVFVKAVFDNIDNFLDNKSVSFTHSSLRPTVKKFTISLLK